MNEDTIPFLNRNSNDFQDANGDEVANRRVILQNENNHSKFKSSLVRKLTTLLILVLIGTNLFFYLRAKLVNYWDMSTLSDEIGGINLCDGLNYNFTKNRFNSPYQAIRLSNGYLKFDQYPQLSTEFSITAWLKVNSNKARMEFLYFSDSNLEKNSVKIDFIDSLLHFEKTNPNLDVKSPIVVDSGAWHHLTVVVDYNRVNIYINGLMVAQKDYRSNTKNNESFMLLKYIGKTNENNYKNYADLSLDELKIFDGALKSFEVYKEFLKNENEDQELLKALQMD